MPRQMSSLELKRFTGSSDPSKQISALDALNIPYRKRTIGGSMLVGVDVQVSVVQRYMSAMAWDIVEDETIGTGLGR